MNRSAIRSELLEQHATLRTMIEDVRRAASRAHESDALGGAFHAAVHRLCGVLRAHNRREEELLKGVLATIDAWGTVREEIMTEQHVAEHVELFSVLVDRRRTSRSAIVDEAVAAALDRVLEHMAREEIAFLGEDVLRDDAVTVNQFSG